MKKNNSNDKWLHRWPTPEEIEAHAAAHGLDGRGCWLVKTEVSFCPSITQITCRTPNGEPHWFRCGKAVPCTSDGWKRPPMLRPISLDGDPVELPAVVNEQ